MHHVTNTHQWVDTTGFTEGHCLHEIPLPAEHDGEKPWIKKGSASHKALLEVIWDKRFMRNLPYLKNFR